jgi:hypothetical protein
MMWRGGQAGRIVDQVGSRSVGSVVHGGSEFASDGNVRAHSRRENAL